MHSPRILALDAGAGHVAGGVFVPGAGGRLVLEEFALEPRLSDPALEPGWMERTAQALARVSARRNWRGPAALAVPGHLTLTKFVKVPAVKPAKRGKVIQFEAAQNIPFPLAAVAWDHLVVSGDDLDIEIMLTAVKLEVMENLCAAAEAAGFPVKRAAASCLALYRAFRFNYPAVTAPVLVMDIGARSTNLLLIGPGGRFFARTFLLAGNAVTAAVAEELKIDFPAAEALKLHGCAVPAGAPGSGPGPAAVQLAARKFIIRLQLEITRTVGSHGWRTNASPPVALYLTGGGSLLPGLEPVLAAKFNLPVERYDPWQNVDMSEQARAAGAAAATHVLANLVGLAVPGAAAAETGLLPPAICAARAFQRRQPILLGAVTLLALALWPPIWHFSRVAAADRERATELRVQLRPRREIAERNALSLGKIAMAEKQAGVLQGLLDARASWSSFLQDLQDRLGQVGDVWLEQLAVVPPPAPGRVANSGKPVSADNSLQLRLSGRLLDPQNPLAKASPESFARAKELMASLTGSPYVTAIGDGRFDNSQPGLLRFDFTLRLNPRNRL